MDNKYLIEKYLHNNLNSKEQLLFDTLIDKDKEFKSEVDFQVNLQQAIKKEDEDNFRNFIQDLEQKNTSKPNYLKWMLVASIVAIFSLIFTFFSKETTSFENLYAANFKPYKNVIVPQVRGEETKTEKTIAFSAYEKGDYKSAISKFSALYKTTKEPYYLFYKANALLQIGNVKEAIPLLKAYLKTNDSLAEKSNWYLVLAYLKLKDKKQAKEYLDKIVRNNLYNSKKAKNLIAKLD